MIPRSILRPILLRLLLALAVYQRYFCLPRSRPYVRVPTGPNPKTGLFNFPDYTYETSPFYVLPTWKNQWGPWALLNRLRSIGIPGPKYDSQGIAWEVMGAKRGTVARQQEAEDRVRRSARILIDAEWGYRTGVPFQPRPLIKPLSKGYGIRKDAFPEDVEPYPSREVHGVNLAEKD